jgi:hypothetical protein
MQATPLKREFGLSGVVKPRCRGSDAVTLRNAQIPDSDSVEFQYEVWRSPVVGMLTCYNKKTVTVITDSAQRWNVAPRLLRRAAICGRSTGA